VTRNLEAAVQRTFEAVPEPRVVIAVGACASGDIVGRSYAGGVGDVLPVDVFIPGCPLGPEAITNGILLAVGRGWARSAEASDRSRADDGRRGSSR
jgi:Ni,Fe-hydrogenase III small subunit